jgi:hypothetical protein
MTSSVSSRSYLYRARISAEGRLHERAEDKELMMGEKSVLAGDREIPKCSSYGLAEIVPDPRFSNVFGDSGNPHPAMSRRLAED